MSASRVHCCKVFPSRPGHCMHEAGPRRRGDSMTIVLVLATLSCCACSTPPPEWEPATTPGPRRVEIFRGLLSEPQPGRLTLIPCGLNLHVDVEDRTGGDLQAARAELAPSARAELLVEMRVERGVRTDDWRTPQDRMLVALELLRAMPVGEGDWCATALKAGETRASGNEPFWSVTVSPSGIEWNEPDLPEPLTFPAAISTVGEASGSSRTWSSTRSSTRPGEERRQLRIVTTPGRCLDGMSGAWYSLAAEVTLDDRIFHGCAYDGG